MPASDTSDERADAPETDGELSDQELRELAERIYDLLRREARVERERLGRSRPRRVQT
jgi:hypothetical protein